MQINKPFYTLRIESVGCGYVIYINGCLIEFHNEMAPLNIEYPINHWLKNGNNALDVHLRNVPNRAIKRKMIAEQATIKCTLVVKEFGSEKSIPLSDLCFSGKELPRKADAPHRVDYERLVDVGRVCSGSTPKGGYAISSKGLDADIRGGFEVGEISFLGGQGKPLKLHQPITLTAPFPEWQFFSANVYPSHYDLSDDEWNQARKEMLVEYQKLWRVIDSGNLDDLKPILEERCAEYDQAFYQSEGQNLKEFIDELRLDLADPEWPLEEPSLKNCDYAVSFSGQLVWLHGFRDPMSGAIQLCHTQSDLAKKYMFYFAKINGQWKVVR